MHGPIPRPHPERCDPTRADYAEIVAAHERAVLEGQPFYRDPSTGLMVLTVDVHLQRGACCDSHCRHCPYVKTP